MIVGHKAIIIVTFVVNKIEYADVVELADTPDLGSGGRPWGFESLHPH